MKLKYKEFQDLFNQDNDESLSCDDYFDQEKVEEKINKLHTKEKRADNEVYRNKDSKRRFKR